MGWFVYILRCHDESLYTGITTDVKRREAEHNSDLKGAKYTKARRPVSIVYKEKAKNRSVAATREAALKKLSRAQKIAFIGEKLMKGKKVT